MLGNLMGETEDDNDQVKKLNRFVKHILVISKEVMFRQHLL